MASGYVDFWRCNFQARCPFEGIRKEFCAMRRKPIMMALSLAAAATVAVAGTTAFLTSSDTVTNTFTVGKVSITLDETKVNPDGTPDPSAERVEENTYHLIPGNEYVKDPTVTVKANSEESYVRMIVTLNKYAALKEIFDDERLPDLPQDYVEGWDNNVWRSVGGIKVNADDTCTMEFRYSTLDANGTLVDKTVTGAADDYQLEPLFEKVVVNGKITGEQLAKLYDDNGTPDDPTDDVPFTISVTAHAIQKSTFETADEAWVAFGEQTGL